MFKLSYQESVIGRRFILYTLLFSSLVTVLFTIVQVSREFDREHAKHLQFEQIIEQSLLDSLSKSIWAYDDSQIYSQLQGINNLPSIDRVLLSLPDSVQFSVGQINADYIATKTFSINYTNQKTAQKMGDLTVYSSLDDRYIYLVEYGLMILTVNFAKTLFVVVFMFFLFDRLVSRHLVRIASEIASYNQGDRPIRIHLNRKNAENKDELDMVVESINNLQQRVFFEQSKVQNESKQKELLHAQVIDQKEKLIELERNIGLNEFALSLRVEIRKPLFKLRVCSELVHRQANTIPYDLLAINNGLEDISKNISRALAVIDRSNDLFKYNQPQCTPVNINDSIANTLMLLSHNLQEASVMIKHQTQGQYVMAFVDEKHIEQVLVSIVRNAIEALSSTKNETSIIEISAFKRGGNVVIDIADNGPGIDESLVKQIFSPYYTTKKNGLGIGLSISKNLVLEMGGTMTATNNMIGLSVVIELPANGLDVSPNSH